MMTEKDILPSIKSELDPILQPTKPIVADLQSRLNVNMSAEKVNILTSDCLAQQGQINIQAIPRIQENFKRF